MKFFETKVSVFYVILLMCWVAACTPRQRVIIKKTVVCTAEAMVACAARAARESSLFSLDSCRWERENGKEKKDKL